MNGSDDNEEFEVDKIVAQRRNNSGVIEYKIRWKGFASDFDTWEPEANLIGCEEVLHEFKLNNVMLCDIKKDFEDGEVSETDSSDDESSDVVHRRNKRNSKSKKKKSKRKNSSKSDNPRVKGEFQTSPNVHGFNDDLGIKVEIAANNQNNDTNKTQSFTTNFSMGASELLLNYYANPMLNLGMESECKQEYFDLTDEPVVKEEKSCNEFVQETLPVEAVIEQSDSDSDCEGQLKVVINDEQEQPTDKSIEETPIESASQSDKARFWREQLDTGNFKIRKTQRKDNQSQLGEGETTLVLAKDKWNVKIKDSQMEAFYNLPVLPSLQEMRLSIDKEIIATRSGSETMSKEDIMNAVECGNSTPIWRALLRKDTVLNDGELLILASKMGYSDIIGMIIRAGVDVNYQNEEGNTALMTTCENGHELACQLLILNGAYINISNKKGESALLKVVARGHKECLVVLLQYGCDVLSLEGEKSPLQIARQRNLHEMELLITDYHKKLSETLTARFVAAVDSLLTISYVLFPLRVASLYEEAQFLFDFDAKIPPVKEDECNLLLIFTGLVQGKQIRCCFEPITQIQSVILNDIDQQSLIADGKNYIMSMSPILDGKNVLHISCESRIDLRWVRLLAIGFRVKIGGNKSS